MTKAHKKIINLLLLPANFQHKARRRGNFPLTQRTFFRSLRRTARGREGGRGGRVNEEGDGDDGKTHIHRVYTHIYFIVWLRHDGEILTVLHYLAIKFLCVCV